MNNISHTTEYENNYLARTLSFAAEELSRTRLSGDEIKSAILSAKKEMRENTPHTIGSLWGSEAFEALAALNQYADPINNQLIQFSENENKILRLENTLKSPYFARIDFHYSGDEQEEQIYIGRSSLKDAKTHEMYIYDWRSPIAGVFYRFTVGEAYYDAPGGRIKGNLVFKRQYEIKNGVMEYYFDADVQIIDEFLRKLLSQNTSNRMKAIVETIQKEQDIVIRDMENDLMIVQGVAGSGKTSIALHRAAYLMYQGLANHLFAHNILIISPNSLFEQYISKVLPDLGEDNVVSAVFEEIAGKVLNSKKIETRDQYLEKMLNLPRYDECVGLENISEYSVMKTRIEFKTSVYFADLIDRFITEIPTNYLRITNIDYCGQRIMSASQIHRKITASGLGIPLGMKLKQIEEYITEALQSVHRLHKNHEEFNRIKSKLHGFTNLDAKALYRYMFTDEHYLAELRKVTSPEIIAKTVENLAVKTIHYDDIAALFYLHLRIHGTKKYNDIRQVVIDEAQDYYPLHYKVFKLLFGNAKYTVLGDINQTLEKEEDISLYTQVKEILDKPKSSLAAMDKSFRCTNEILKFSARFLSHDLDVKSFNRKGTEPQINVPESDSELVLMLAAEVEKLREASYQSVGLICKTASNARILHHELDKKTAVNLIKEGAAAELNGVFIIPVYLAKGLEFDAVLICDADGDNYHSNEDKKLLYIASTRALHYLGVYGVGEVSPLIR